MIFSLDVRRARKGDCLLLHFGSKDDPGLVMIDGGPKSVYAPHLRPRLLEIRKARGLGQQAPLPVDLLMISHVDDDHIQGILDLTRELIAASQPPLIRVLRFWHNSFDDLIGQNPQELTSALTAQFGTASTSGALPDDATIDSDEPAEVITSSLKVLASIAQGHQLRLDAQRLGFRLNPQFDGQLVMAGKKKVAVSSGMTFTVAGPMQPELLELQKKHDEWLKTMKKNGGTSEESPLAAYVDKSVPNLSSIVVLATLEGKTILLTGDARGDKILEGLELTGALAQGGNMHVDILKVPHHGSSNNLDNDFFQRITADHYVFSGDGEHGNPERESLEMLLGARGSEPFTVHLTYPIDEIDAGRKADWEKEQAKERRKKAAGGKKEPRADWVPAEHSLASLFQTRPLAKGQAIHIVDAVQPHVINLLEPLGY